MINTIIYNWLVLFSKAFNTLHLGTPHESWSQKVARKVIIEKTDNLYFKCWAKIIDWVFKRLGEKDHLRDALDSENKSKDVADMIWGKK